MTIVSNPANCALARQEIGALALINDRRERSGLRPLAMLEQAVPSRRERALHEAEAVLSALRKRGVRI